MNDFPEISAKIGLKIQFYHLDPMEIVWHGNYPRFLEKARCALLDLIGYNYEEMRKSGYAWPIVDMRIKYVQSAYFKQDVSVIATLKEYENRLVIDYKIIDDKSGTVITKARTTQVALQMATKEMMFESPAILIEKVEAFR